MVLVAFSLFVAANPVVEARRIPAAELPFERVSGLAVSSDNWLVGGLRGLYVGKPGGPWKQASDQAVRAIADQGGSAWVQYGNGSLDKVDVTADKLYYDVLSGATKRPWVSSLSLDGKSILLGGQGGWMVKTPDALKESYPSELKGLPVTSLTRIGEATWLGTQDGLFQSTSGGLKRFGFASGLPDSWVTSLLPSNDSLLVGTAAGGLAKVKAGKVSILPSPSKRKLLLSRWQGHLVLGALDGAWLRDREEWIRLTDTEATFLSEVGNELVVGTPSGVRFFRLE